MHHTYGRPPLTAAELTYTNTIADAVRMQIDQCHVLGPRQEGVRALLTGVAGAWLSEMETRAQAPANNFNMLASPQTCRVATTQVMRRLALQTIARDACLTEDEPSAAQRADGQQAMALVEETLLRLMTQTGFRDERTSARSELRDFNAARNVVNAQIFRERRRLPAPEHLQDSYVAWWQQVDLEARDGKVQVADTPLLRQTLLAAAMTDTMEWAVSEAFRMAVRGENTAGRMLAALDVPLTPKHVLLHEPAAVPGARSLREMQFAVSVLSADLQSPTGRLNAMATDDYFHQLSRLRLDSQPVNAAIYSAAAAPAQEYADKVGRILTQLVHRGDGWVEPPVALSTAARPARFMLNGTNTLQ